MSAAGTSSTIPDLTASIWDEVAGCFRLPGGHDLTPQGVVSHAVQVAISRIQSIFEDGHIRGLSAQQMEPLSDLWNELSIIQRSICPKADFGDLVTPKQLALAMNVTDIQTHKSLQTLGVTNSCGDFLGITKLWDRSVNILIRKFDLLESAEQWSVAAQCEPGSELCRELQTVNQKALDSAARGGLRGLITQRRGFSAGR